MKLMKIIIIFYVMNVLKIKFFFIVEMTIFFYVIFVIMKNQIILIIKFFISQMISKKI